MIYFELRPFALRPYGNIEQKSTIHANYFFLRRYNSNTTTSLPIGTVRVFFAYSNIFYTVFFFL